MIHKNQRTTKKNRNVRIVDAMFYHEAAIKKAVYDERNDNGAHTAGNTAGKLVSDPTASRALQAALPLRKVTLLDGFTVREPEAWLEVIAATYNWLGEEAREAVSKRYAGEEYLAVCRDMHIAPSTLFRWSEEARHYAIAAACQYGLLRVV